MGVNTCSICAETYAVSHLGDVGKCRLCEIREPAMRRKIAAEVHALGGSMFMVEQIKRGPVRHTIGGMSDLTIPEFDVPYEELLSASNDIAHDV
jgi:hypothetical protein